MSVPRKKVRFPSSPPADWGDGGFSNPGVYDTLEEAVAATEAAEDEYLSKLDSEDDSDED
jgi:hypothetical protein